VLGVELDGRQRTRPELAAALVRVGIQAAGLRLGYIMMHAELEQLICSGPRRGKQFTYALLDERVPSAKTLDRDAALAELTKRFFQSHGPALVEDFAGWSGLTVADAGGQLLGNWRRAIKGRAMVVESAPWRPWSATEQQAFAAAAERLGAFVGLPVMLT